MCACFVLFGLWATKSKLAHSKHKFKKKTKGKHPAMSFFMLPLKSS